ncbi:MAG TPA: alpha/beta-type small acid-soluble spore protein [Candidatus Fimadaptatus faecigallinarum]|uniref:Alpha/beta-type small acid-soluble spore protein n=1 Tax=Candidatus Fimadaptatus faecigallinarum TaxID=2840814 RepID=A0A9D1LRG0_9FIRM|nr:alpha/beta-type small acid-soluble spore protein [Candidatus Fimadaptatus faecigallinarum]
MQNQKPNQAQNQNQAQSQSSSSRINVPSARQALNTMKQEIAGELGVNLKQGYNGDLTSREAGSIGGGMVKRMIEQQERQMSGQQGNMPR